MPNVTETHTCGRHVYLIDQTSEKVETVQERVTSGIIAHQTVVEMQSYVHEQTWEIKRSCPKKLCQYSWNGWLLADSGAKVHMFVAEMLSISLLIYLIDDHGDVLIKT